jgi:Icc-related predicted phosphoesterase
MRVNVISDLHLEFAPLELPGGDVLILAGDVCELRSLKKDVLAEKPEDWKLSSGREWRCQRFFEVECAKYSTVLYVLGNHEHYHGRYDRTLSEIRGLVPPNVTILQDETVTHGEVVFIGSTLWTDMNKGDALTVWNAKNSVNDFKRITYHYKDAGTYGKLRPEVTVAAHRHSVEYMRSVLSAHADSKIVVISHHAPSELSVAPSYKNDHQMNGAYRSDLSEFILDHPQIKVWVHGHMHDPCDYTIGETRVLANPRGYHGHESRAIHFDPSFYFDV